MINFFDCSNSIARPPHRGGGGPLQNDTMRLLELYASRYGFCKVDSPKEADVVITNDVFPDCVLRSKKPRVKRMDGLFWQPSLASRRDIYLKAASQADAVVTISRYVANQMELFKSKWKFKKVYEALNWVDPLVFYPDAEERGTLLLSFVAVATDWSRPEKRFSDVLEFAKANEDVRVWVVGNVGSRSKLVPENVILCGYKEEAELAFIIRTSVAMLNLSYLDPAPKVVAQASASGLPVLYADSGGTGEQVNVGVPIVDISEPNGDAVPVLRKNEVADALRKFKRLLEDGARDVAIREAVRFNSHKFDNTVGVYFTAMRDLVRT